MGAASNSLSGGLPLMLVAPLIADSDLPVVILTIVLLVISLGIHEAAHAWVAWKCGDSTAKDLGRITLNPIPHIDLFQTILLPAMLFYAHLPIFGGAKPVPVAFHRLRHPWRDMSLVAIAGPASNFLLAIFFMTLWHAFVVTGWYNGAALSETARHSDLLPVVLMNACGLNIVLAVFNMVPIPPLDGSRILAWMLPPPMRQTYASLEPFGLFIILALLWQVPGFRSMLRSIERQVAISLLDLVTLGGRW